MAQKRYIVTVVVDAENVTCADVADYVTTAVARWGGSYHLEHEFSPDNIKVSVPSTRLYRKLGKRKREPQCL